MYCASFALLAFVLSIMKRLYCRRPPFDDMQYEMLHFYLVGRNEP